MPRKARWRARPATRAPHEYRWEDFVRNTGIFVVLQCLIGANLIAFPRIGGLVPVYGFCILVCGILQLLALVPDETLQTFRERPLKSIGMSDGGHLARWRVRWLLWWIGIAAVLLIVVITMTGGPIVSPYGQYLLGFCLIIQTAAPRSTLVWKIFVGTVVLAGASWLMSQAREPREWEFVFPALLIAAASTVINTSQVAELTAERRKYYQNHLNRT